MGTFLVLDVVDAQILLLGEGNSRQLVAVALGGALLGHIALQSDGLLTKDDVPRQARPSSGNDGTEGITPEHLGRHGGRLTREGIDEVNNVGNVLHHDQTGYIAKISRRLGGEVEQIVLTKGADLDVVGVLEIGYVGLVIGANELLGHLGFDGDDVLEERDESRGLALVGEVEVHTISEGFDAQTATVGTVLEDELLQVEEGTLVVDALPDLDQTLPAALTELGLTFDALLIPNDEHNDKTLLQDGTCLDLLLDRETDLEAHGMRLGPNPASVDESNLVTCGIAAGQSTDLGQAQGHELTALQLASQPLASILMPSLAATALVEGGLGANAAGDVGLACEARGTRVGWVGSDGNAAHAAQDVNHGSTAGSSSRWEHWVFHGCFGWLSLQRKMKGKFGWSRKKNASGTTS